MFINIKGEKKVPVLSFPAIKEVLVSAKGIKVIKVDDGLCSAE